MNTRVQFMKEARQLAWPWALVMTAGVFASLNIPVSLPFASHLERAALPMGFLFGIPLLAALPFGSEFQARTMTLRLAQPIERSAIWREKMVMTIALVWSPAALFAFAAWRQDAIGGDIATLCSAMALLATTSVMPFTLIARSTVGGLALSIVFHSILGSLWLWALNSTYDMQKAQSVPAPFWWAAAVIIVADAVAMVWWGRRLMLRFQVQDGMQAGEAFVPGVQLVPTFLVEMFRCRATEPFGNLMRREVRLLRSLWPLVLMSCATWAFIAAFGWVPIDRRQRAFTDVIFGLSLMLNMIIAVLAGALSLGEDKALGTHGWHMTLPISPSVQWLVKLLVAVFTSVLFGAVMPIFLLLMGGWLRGAPWRYVSGDQLWAFPLEVTVLSLLAFWCACVVRSTVKAVLWLFPVLGSLMMAGAVSMWFAESFVVRPLQDRIDLIKWGPRLQGMFWLQDGPQRLFIIAALPVLLFALVQSGRLFRGEMTETTRQIARCLAPLVALACAIGLASTLVTNVAISAWQVQYDMVHETHVAIELLRPGMEKAPTRSAELTMQDLQKVSPLSARTMFLLRDARIIVVTQGFAADAKVAAARTRGGMWYTLRAAPGQTALPYSAIIRGINGGHSCSLTYAPMFNARYGSMGSVCD